MPFNFNASLSRCSSFKQTRILFVSRGEPYDDESVEFLGGGDDEMLFSIASNRTSGREYGSCNIMRGEEEDRRVSIHGVVVIFFTSHQSTLGENFFFTGQNEYKPRCLHLILYLLDHQ